MLEASKIYKGKRKVYRDLIRKAKEAKWIELVDDLERDQWGLGYQIHPTTEWNIAGNSEIEYFTQGEMKRAVGKLKTDKAPGPDNIPVEVIRAMANGEGGELMRRVYNKLLHTGTFPKEWKAPTSRKCSHPAPYKGYRRTSKQTLSLYVVNGRKLYILTFWMGRKSRGGRAHGKGVQRAGDKRVRRWATRATDRRVTAFLNWATSSPATSSDQGGRETMGVANTTKARQDGHRAEECPIREKQDSDSSGRNTFLFRAVTDSGHVLAVLIDNQEQKTLLLRKMGSICGPSVWNMMMDELLMSIENVNMEVVAYADDVLCLIEGMSRTEIETKGTEVSAIIENWGHKVGVEVSEDKTVMTLMKGNLSNITLANVRMRGKVVWTMKEVQYLGIHVGERMNFRPHLEKMNAKIVAVMGKMRRVEGKECACMGVCHYVKLSALTQCKCS
ncbi:uncharacterized protein LOC135265347 [Tribolium castaneum]|uniref:uncharacterized protein LOC135265347 n=1 Tax=Tribolium castaneum TaxID=7070 RepID=UPI0030FEB59E